MKLRPTAGKALIKAEIPPDVSEGGIALPVDREGDPKDNPNIGIVLAVGPPLDGTVLPDIKKGDRVLFTDFWTTKTGQKDVYVVEQKDIVAVLEPEPGVDMPLVDPEKEEVCGNEERPCEGRLENRDGSPGRRTHENYRRKGPTQEPRAEGHE